jgi:hypothetical protein
VSAVFRKNTQRLRALSNNRMLLPLWLSWQAQRRAGREPVLRLFGFRFSGFSGFYDFNAFVGAYHYRSDAAELNYLTTYGTGAGDGVGAPLRRAIVDRAFLANAAFVAAGLRTAGPVQ